MRKYEKQVNEGILFLNEYEPDWKRRIKKDVLDMSQSTECILGQLLGHLPTNSEYIAKVEAAISFNSDWPINHGFQLPDIKYNRGAESLGYTALTNEWKRHLNA